jgi:Bacterial toxin 33
MFSSDKSKQKKRRSFEANVSHSSTEKPIHQEDSRIRKGRSHPNLLNVPLHPPSRVQNIALNNEVVGSSDDNAQGQSKESSPSENIVAAGMTAAPIMLAQNAGALPAPSGVLRDATRGLGKVGSNLLRGAGKILGPVGGFIVEGVFAEPAGGEAELEWERRNAERQRRNQPLQSTNDNEKPKEQEKEQEPRQESAGNQPEQDPKKPKDKKPKDKKSESEKERNPAQDKELGKGEIKRLKEGDVDVHELKGGKNASKQDLFKDREGNIYVKPKGGRGPGEPTGLNVNDF